MCSPRNKAMLPKMLTVAVTWTPFSSSSCGEETLKLINCLISDTSAKSFLWYRAFKDSHNPNMPAHSNKSVLKLTTHCWQYLSRSTLVNFFIILEVYTTSGKTPGLEITYPSSFKPRSYWHHWRFSLIVFRHSLVYSSKARNLAHQCSHPTQKLR